MERVMDTNTGLPLSQKVSEKLRNLNFICTILIVMHHLPIQSESTQLYHWFRRFVTSGATLIFFAISGYLVARHIYERGWFVTLLKKRIRNLVIPYFMVNTLYVPFIVVYHNIFGKGSWQGGGVGFNMYSISRLYGLNPVSNPACGPFWFVRTLFLFTLITPALVWVIKCGRIKSLLLVLGLLILARLIEINDWYCDFQYGFFNIRGLAFYLLGMNLYVYGIEMDKRIKPWLYLYAIASVIVLGVGIAPAATFAISAMFWLVVAVGIWAFTPTQPIPKWLAKSTFAIFALHTLIFYPYSWLINSAYGQFLNLPIVQIAVPLLIGAGVPIAIKSLIDYRWPRISTVMFGGR